MNSEKAAIVHFTNRSDKRPGVNQRYLSSLKKYALSKGYDDVDIFCDYSLNRSQRTELDRFLSCQNQYKAVFVKDYYHFHDKTTSCMSILKDIRSHGVQIYTQLDGSFTWKEAPLDKPLRVVTYTCHWITDSEIKKDITLSNNIFTLFVKKKTNWTIVDQYFDECPHQTDSAQIMIHELIKNRDKYDLLLVNNMRDVNWRTAKFCKIRQQIGLDIYSFQDGCLEFSEVKE